MKLLYEITIQKSKNYTKLLFYKKLYEIRNVRFTSEALFPIDNQE